MRHFRSILAFASLGALPALGAIGPVTDLVIDSSLVSPDGPTYARTAIQAGGTVIGSLITGNKGDTFQINVINNLHDNTMLQSTSIHWHGFFQSGTNYADGGAFVSQCPIAKGHSFQYKFNAADQAGTFWYHSHLSTQYCDGLRGPMVVYDPSDPHASLYDVDDESTVITFADWYHAKAKNIFIGVSDSTLINGLGRYGGVGGTQSPLSVITVEQGKRYRFRLVNIACDPMFTVQFNGHNNLQVIEVDGINHVAHTVDSLDIFPGQRYSVVLTADQPIDNYWIRAKPSLSLTPTFLNGINSAILRYVGAPDAEPTSLVDDTSTNALNEADLVPLENPGAPGIHSVGAADVVHTLVITFTGLAFQINGFSFVPPTVPVLLQILSGQQTAQSLLPAGSVYLVEANDVVEITIPGGAFGGPHPFHLHGHAFDVVRSAGSTTYNYVNPPRRDVVSTGNAGDLVTIRFRADNPGPWFLHCHIDWHLELGLAIVFAESTDEWVSTIDPPPAWDDLCPTYNALAPGDLRRSLGNTT